MGRPGPAALTTNESTLPPMSIHHTVNAVGHLMAGGSTALAGLIWASAQTPVSTISEGTAQGAGWTAIVGLILGFLTLVVNKHFDLELRKLTNDDRFTALLDEIATLKTDARIELILRDREAKAVLAARATADDAGTRRDVAIEQLQVQASVPPLPSVLERAAQILATDPGRNPPIPAADAHRWADDGGPHPETH